MSKCFGDFFQTYIRKFELFLGQTLVEGYVVTNLIIHIGGLKALFEFSFSYVYANMIYK
jgi:hypothetical protein